MKHANRWLGALVLVHLAVTGALVTFLPARVPVHYDVTGAVDRVGSRYEYLLLPVISALMALFFVVLARTPKRTAAERRTLFITGMLIIAFFTILGTVLILSALRVSRGAAAPDFPRITAIFLGLLICAISNFLPKVRRNGLIGLRTKWSLSSDRVWQRSQRFGAISGVACGAAIILAGCLLEGLAALIALAVLIVLWALACTLASWRYASQEPPQADKKEPL